MDVDNLTLIFIIISIIIVLNLIKMLCWGELELNNCACKK